jgi:hypothetical protein
MELNRFKARIQQIGDLLFGWDSYGAPPIRRDVLEYAIKWIPSLLNESTPFPTIVPEVCGGIQVEWHINGIDLEIYIDAPDNVSFWAIDTYSGGITGNKDEWILPENYELLLSWIGRLSTRCEY